MKTEKEYQPLQRINSISSKLYSRKDECFALAQHGAQGFNIQARDHQFR